MCCGQKRSQLQSNQAQRTARTVPQYVSGNSRSQAVRTQPTAPVATQTVSPHQPVNLQTRSIQPRAAMPISAPRSSVSVRYLETSPIRVQGPVSGMLYEFSGARPVQLVDVRDASPLLNARFFRRA
jgi:hypothetical protein